MKHLSIKPATTIAMTLVLASATPAFADNCGKSDRVTPPKCVYIMGNTNDGESGTYSIRNECSHAVTLKWDQSGSDHRQTFQPTSADGDFTHVPQSKYSRRTIISCCPRYNSCG